MNPGLLKFKITPRVVKAGKKQTITVQGLDDSCLLYDDCEYIVSIFKLDGYSYREDTPLRPDDRDNLTTIHCYPQKGKLQFEYTFEGEMPWRINIKRAETEKHLSDFAKEFFYWNITPHVLDFCVYSLEEDLYDKKPFKGDLHVHTCRSDGLLSPSFMAAQYRKFGYDFLAITDHYFYEPSIELIEKMSKTKAELKLFPGEEVHHSGLEYYSFHVVNFNGKYSINEMIRNDPDGVLEEVQALAKTVDCLEEDKLQVAWYKWIYQEIKKAEGIVIYPHPLWILGNSYNIKLSVSDAIYKNGYCDIVEIFGGGGNKINHKLQPMLYYDGKAKGYDYPIIASTDAHSSLQHNDHGFDHAFSIVYSETADNIPENILKGNTAAIDNWNADEQTAYTSFRLARYTYFLLDEYYPMHDSFCNATGQALLRLVLGDNTQDELVGKLEEELKKFDKDFFGK